MISSPIQHHTLTLPTTSLHVVIAGPDAGPPVVLLHGFPETWWSWRHQIDALVDAGFRVIAPDLRGFGQSARHGPFDLATLAADIVALMSALGCVRASIVGHDWGGAVAWQLAAHHPEHVDRLVVIDCPLPERLEQLLMRSPRWDQVRRSWYIYFFQLPWVAEWLIGRHDAGNVLAAIRGSAVCRQHMSDAELAPFREAARPFAARRAMLGVYRAAFRDALRRGFRPRPLPQIGADTLLVWGAEDPALGFYDLVPGTEAVVPRLRVERLAGVGHFPHSERPERVNTLLREHLGAR